MSLVNFHTTMRRMFTRRIVRFLYGSQKRIMGWHSVRKWKRPIPSILRARPRANDEEYGAHDAPKRKTGDMDQVGFRAADFSQKTAKRTCASHHALCTPHMPLFPRGRSTKHFHVQRICARLILFPSGKSQAMLNAIILEIGFGGIVYMKGMTPILPSAHFSSCFRPLMHTST
ncbi:hypothetical protein ALC57_05558 [Trachymyrmex cornetzi]|uniref:Uncharacterized protein n=1 Tax=Trachymyrmex cornetzi TaxID=471704 RepID=A0A151JAH7_9HYME|nr:hypothetical protein ALC57_05558 [Trachymyrmex cornetzi]